MTDTRRTLELLVVALVITIGAVWAIGRASATDTAERVRAEMRDSVAFEVALAVAPLRRAAAEANTAMLAAEAKLAKVRTTGRATLASTGATVDTHRADTASADADTLRQALTSALAAYDSLAAAFRDYLHTDSVAHIRTATRDSVTSVLLNQQDRALVAMTQARDAWKQAATCRTVFGIKCPTRTQAFVGGAVVALAAVVVLR
jgi:hypothetical protein